MTVLSFARVAAVAFAFSALVACSSDDPEPATPEGSGGSSSGGSTPAGGTPASGGAASSGGMGASGASGSSGAGGRATGGAASGGAASGGTASGGTASGGAPPLADGGIPARCLLPLEVGTCPGGARVFYFDAASGSCKAFTYSGCGGNENNFATEEDCEAACE